MIDIWMLFTMTVPFLEVALHTCTEVMKRPGVPQFSPKSRVHQVNPADRMDLELPQPKITPAWVGVVGRLLLPLISILFTLIFWILGLSASYWTKTQQDSSIHQCLTIELD